MVVTVYEVYRQLLGCTNASVLAAYRLYDPLARQECPSMGCDGAWHLQVVERQE